MPLVLRIENVDTLPDGGPVFVEIDRRGIDIGRDTFLDWTLPDPERFISGKHCEIHFKDGGYWLHDVSTNGTSINGQAARVTEPHKLQHGDRIHIGPYIVLTELSGVEAGPGGHGPVPDKGGTSVGGDPWGGLEGTAEAIDRRDFTARSQASGRNDPGDLAEENISWGFGDLEPKADQGAAGSDWGAPAAPTPAASNGAADEWGAPAKPASASPNEALNDWGAAPTPASEPSASAGDWGAPSASPAPSEPAPSADAAEWGAPSQPASSGSPDVNAGLDWGAPADAEDQTSDGGSPWDVAPAPAAKAPTPEPEAPKAAEPSSMLEPRPAAEAPVGDNPFLAAAPISQPAVPTAEKSEPAASTSDDGGAFGALSEQPSPSDTPAPEPEPAVGLSEQWAGGEQEAPRPESVETPPAPTPVVAASTPYAGDRGFIAAFERGAGLPAGSIADRSDEVLAEELGRLFHDVTKSLQAMLLARAETKSAMRSSERTMIGALENNPLKFSPTPEDALRIMFGQKSRSYLDASQTIEQSFSDLQKHQMQTFGAMQSALQVLIEDLDPETIAGATAKDGGLAALVSSRRAKFWDTYVERFKAKSAHHDRGMIDAFMILFAEMYDRQG